MIENEARNPNPWSEAGNGQSPDHPIPRSPDHPIPRSPDSPISRSPDARLMLRIKSRWGAAIDEACRYSSVPPAFLAALIANESGGNPAAKRFEKSVYNKLLNVQRGYAESYGALSAALIRPASNAALIDLASSWGLTQIMGYHVAADPNVIGILIGFLKDPVMQLKFTCGMLAEFAERFGLNLTAEFAELFRCWNSGRPDGETTDPKYAERGVERMEIYRGIG